MSDISDAISEIRDFADSFLVDSLLSRSKLSASFSTSYKQLHALLIWSIVIDGGSFPKNSYGHHPKEAISDISQAYALVTFSLYKPSRILARSAIENITRVVVASKGGDYEVKSVYTLFDIAKDILEEDLLAVKILASLKVIYGELCLSVHSAHKDHVALRIPFEEVFAHDDTQSAMTVSVLRRAAASINQLLYVRFSNMLSTIPHKNRDALLDSLPKSVKRAVQL